MKILEKLFRFPIVMIDGDNEEKKARTSDTLALDNEQEADIIIGEAECPYYDFVSVTDRWLPTQDSLDKALDGEFEACGVTFSQSGSFIVPWNKKKFKREFDKFVKIMPDEEIGAQDLIELINESNLPKGDK